MEPFALTPAILAAISGAVLSLAFSYIPGLNVRFAELTPEIKRLVMAGLLLVISAVIYASGCAGIVQAGITCDQQGIVQLAWILISAIMANQSTYNLTPRTEAVKQASGG